MTRANRAKCPPRKSASCGAASWKKLPAAWLESGTRIALRREGSRELANLHSRATAEGNHLVGDYEVTLEAGSYRASVRANGFETLVDPSPIEISTGSETTRDFILTRTKPVESNEQGIRGVVTVIDSGATPPPIKIQIATLGSSRPPLNVQPGSNVSFSQNLPPVGTPSPPLPRASPAPRARPSMFSKGVTRGST